MTVTMQEAQAALPELIRRLPPGGELVITDGGRRVATLVAAPPEPGPPGPPKPRQPGTLRGTVLSMEHFDDPLEEFEEYM